MPTRSECANAIRALSIDAIEKAASGHPGAPLGMADMAEALWRGFLKHNPEDPTWPDRDRFILSNGHASMLLYSLLYLTGYKVSIDDIMNFRQLGSITPGHPERDVTPGVEMTTGPLGQGISSAVGLALAEAMLAAQFNRPGHEIVNHYTWCFAGEGCLMEGLSHEACSLASIWKLGKLIVFFDSNGVSIDGNVDPWFAENVEQRYTAYGWQVIGPINGHDGEAIDRAVLEAKSDTVRPSLIICKTHIGFGSPKRDTSASHGAPLGEKDALATKKTLNWNEPPFKVPADILAAWDARKKGAEMQKQWSEAFAAYSAQYPDLAKEFTRRVKGELPGNWQEIAANVLAWAVNNKKALATRVCSKQCLELLVPAMPELVGGSADLSGSVGTKTASSLPLDVETHQGNYIFYGVREFGMGAIMNGMAIHGGFIPYGGTFLSFSDHARNAIRLGALMHAHVIWVLTHDSIGVGEDGPTHQPVEQIPTLRLTPGLDVWRPCDDQETAQAWLCALSDSERPAAMVLSRQKLPCHERSEAQIADIRKGGYILRDCSGTPELIFIASGSEVQLAMAACIELEKLGHACRVVSMPCTEIFDRQPREWRDQVLPGNVKRRLAIEAASPDWWRRYVGLDGDVIGMAGFGASAPGSELFRHFGFTVENTVARAKALLASKL